MVYTLAADVDEAERPILAPNLRVVEHLERRQREVMCEPRVVRLTHADCRLALRPHARAVPFQLPYEVGWVREEVAVQDLRDLVGGGDRWWKGFPGKDSDPRDSRV